MRRLSAALLATGAAVATAATVIALRETGPLRRGPVGNARVPEPARPVDLQRYLGRWYEFARYENRFERRCEAVTAEYSLRADGLIGVRNVCHADAPNGRERAADGRAKLVPGSGNAKLKVSFFGPFFVGDYWILDYADDYAWSIVGEPSGRYLWILTRRSEVGPSEADALYERARSLGYDTDLLRRTRQAGANGTMNVSTLTV